MGHGEDSEADDSFIGKGLGNHEDDDSLLEADDKVHSEDDGGEKHGATEEEEDEDEDEKESDDNSESEDTESESSDSLDEGETEQRRVRYVCDMTDLEKQFTDLKEQLYKERMTQIERQLDEVNHSEAKEYTGPLKQLEVDCDVRVEVADYLRKFRIRNLENSLKCELQSAEQHFQNQDQFLKDELMQDLEEKLRKVEEDRQTLEMYSDLWSDDSSRNRKKRKSMEMFVPEKRKKPVTVSGPYIVYMLRDMDILEDWAAIRKAKSELARRKAAELYRHDKHPQVAARYEDGKFFYEGEWFQKGEKVVLDNRIDSPVHATISAINTGEVWVSKRDGVRCKLYIAQFQKGKYVIRRVSKRDLSTC